MQVKLWKILQEVNDEPRTYDAAVVAAVSEDAARRTHPSGRWLARIRQPDTWCQPGQVKVEYLGEAAPGTKSGVILASWNGD